MCFLFNYYATTCVCAHHASLFFPRIGRHFFIIAYIHTLNETFFSLSKSRHRDLIRINSKVTSTRENIREHKKRKQKEYRISIRSTLSS